MKQKLLRLCSLLMAISFLALLPSEALAAGYTWTDRSSAGSRLWTGIASSSDGKKLAATAQGTSNVYISTDAGVTWTPHSTGATDLAHIASSADGTHLLASANVLSAGDLWTSSDSGATWTDRSSAGSRTWNGLGTSSDGKYLAATYFANTVYTSSDFGVTWTPHVMGASKLSKVVSSSDGSHLAGIDTALGGGDVWTSSNFGTTWTDTGKNSPNWSTIASSADGSRLVAFTNNPGDVYTSSNFGVTWTHQANFTASDQIDAIASSSSGQYLAAAGSGGGTTFSYTSSDYGVSWTQQTSAGGGNWRSIAISADGSRITMVDYVPGDIWTAFDPSLVPGLPNTGGSPVAANRLLIELSLLGGGLALFVISKYAKR